MAPEHDKGKSGYGPHMKKVALTILVIGVSLALVIVAWIGIGVDPNYSAKQLIEQQTSLREEYGLPAQQTSTAELETPPSLRGLEGVVGNDTSIASNGTGGNQTAANQTSAGSANQTASGN
jgi:hypothetical protein